MRKQLEVLRQRGIDGQLRWNKRPWDPTLPGYGPTPEGNGPPGLRVCPVPFPFALFQLQRASQHLPAQTELSTGLGSKPNQSSTAGLPLKLEGLALRTVGEQIQGLAIGQPTEYQGCAQRRRAQIEQATLAQLQQRAAGEERPFRCAGRHATAGARADSVLKPSALGVLFECKPHNQRGSSRPKGARGGGGTEGLQGEQGQPSAEAP